MRVCSLVTCSSSLDLKMLSNEDNLAKSLMFVAIHRGEFCDLPYQAVEVHLANVKPKGQHVE